MARPHVRATQPTKPYLRSWFGGRCLGSDLFRAAKLCIDRTPSGHKPMTWLTCTNAGSAAINYAYLAILGCGRREHLENHVIKLRSGPAYFTGKDNEHWLVIRTGMWLRCTRNIDKERGFCSEALGCVEAVLCCATKKIHLVTATSCSLCG